MPYAQTNRIRLRLSLIDRISLPILLTSSSLGLIFYITWHHLWSITAAIGVIVLLFSRREVGQFLRNWSGHFQQHTLLLQGCLCAILVLLFLLDMTVMPAQAQFMKGAEDFLNDFARQANVDAKVTSLIFSTLRGLFLLYLGISLIRVVQAARNDEDWQTLARTPLIVVVTVVVADVLTGLVIGRT